MEIRFKIGDCVWSTYHGVGIVTSIDSKNNSVEMDFGGYRKTCNKQGFEYDYQENIGDKIVTISRIDDILERLPKDKYKVEKLIDLKKGEVVLIRDSICEVYKIGVFVGLSENQDRPYSVYYDGYVSSWAKCVRYEGNEFLVSDSKEED